MTLDKIVVILAGLAAIAWVLWYFLLSRRSEVAVEAGAAGPREVTITVRGGYEPALVRVARGTPLRLVFDRREEASCSEEVVLPDFGVRRFLPAFAKTAVEITPQKAGSFEFTCGMGMLRGKLVAE